jgi:hypothetical protein
LECTDLERADSAHSHQLGELQQLVVFVELEAVVVAGLSWNFQLMQDWMCFERLPKAILQLVLRASKRV